MRAQTILWLLLRSRKTDLLLVVGEPRDYHAGETGSRAGSWKRRRLNSFQLFDHTGLLTRVPKNNRKTNAIPNKLCSLQHLVREFLPGHRLTRDDRVAGSSD